MIRRIVLALLGVATSGAGSAEPQSLAIRDSFPIGSSGVRCSAQITPLKSPATGMFDRAYSIVCRDAAAPVGSLYALRTDAVALPAERDRQCAPFRDAELASLPGARVQDCDTGNGLRYRNYVLSRRGTLYAADGLAGYDSALRLAFASIIANHVVDGEVQVAVTAAGDPAAFARVQAGSLDSASALNESYLRNNAGNYAEASEFLQTLIERDTSRVDAVRSTEYLINQALQQSNLGNFPAADAALATAEQRGASADPVVGRLLRNGRAMDRLNRGQAAQALTELARTVAPVDPHGTDLIGGSEITPRLATEINRANRGFNTNVAGDTKLSSFERAEILDAQAAHLRGVALRLERRYPEALASLDQAGRSLSAVRQGRVTSTAFIRSDVLGETGLVRDASGNKVGAEAALRDALRLLEENYPRSAALLQAKCRLAAFLGRTGRTEEAMALFGEVVTQSEQVPGAAAAVQRMLSPYFALLAARSASESGAAGAMFSANQVFVRPGVAETQAVLARELSEGNDEAARLFREAVTLSREVVRQSGEVSRLITPEGPEAVVPEDLAAAREKLAGLERDQVALQSQLTKYPRYRVLSPQTLTLSDLQALLRPGEAYYQLRLVGNEAYAIFVTPALARGVKLATNGKTLSDIVGALRDSIVHVENDQQVTPPFDVALARKLYQTLFDPLGLDVLAGVNHLIVEPDGPLLQLPFTLLVVEQEGVDAYIRRVKSPNADEFDLRGIAWLGRDRMVTTAVSARSFADLRHIAPSSAKRAYLGLGENAPPPLQATLIPTNATSGDDCSWPLDTWRHPISQAELQFARRTIGGTSGALLTGADFSDDALGRMPTLRDYRILHFATHGLVTAPKPQCAARPALLTSFGGPGSDGLLSFKEVYDLRLDADYVILSACDTAGMATVKATREAGVTTGGNFALDGLVRAFVGAGARSVIASHWPVPDDFGATETLMTRMFGASPGTAAGQALRAAQVDLMDRAETSHPFYWAAFAIVGDGARPLVRRD